MITQPTRTLMVELDDATWTEFLDRAERWFVQVRLTQVAFRRLAEDMHAKIEEPHVRKYLEQIVLTARQHETRIDGLYRAIGREPADPGKVEQLAGVTIAKSRELYAGLQSGVGGAELWWEELNQLFLASLSALSAFAAAEQLGFALGNKEICDIAIPVGFEKYAQHRMLQEITLELVPHAVLYRTKV